MSTNQTDTTDTNGRLPRKNLASQLDRLDEIIDTLSEGLNGAVADAVQQSASAAAQKAVESIVREVLAHPDLLRALAAQMTPPSASAQSESAKPEGVGARGKRALGSACHWLGQRMPNLTNKLREMRPLGLSLAVGLAAGLIGYLAGPVVSSLALGLCAAGITLTAILAAPLVQLLQSLKAQNP